MFEEWAKAYQDHLVVRNMSPLTIEAYLQPLKVFHSFLESEGVAHLTAVTKETIQDFRLHLQGVLNPKGKPNSVVRQNHYLRAVKFFFFYLREEGYLVGDPTAGISYAKEPQKLPRSILTSAEMKKLLSTPDTETLLGYRDRCAMEVLYSTGIRRGEAMSLLVSDVDYEGGYLRVNAGKGKKDRVVPLGQIACRYLENYIKSVRPKMVKDTSVKHLFLTQSGKPFSKEVIRWMIERYAKKAKIGKRVSPHTFRHTCATLMMKNKANIRHVQELLGHASLNTTQMYTAVSIVDLKEVHRRCHPREKRQ